jgi:eukaryotic-like serine/threonine-protein kinase
METIEALGKYEIKRALGRGAMGIVYEGWDPIIARRVAIKTVKLPGDAADPETKEALTRFRREAQAAGGLTHPNIVDVHDYGETDDIAYIVMEFVDGPTLKSLFDKNERFELQAALSIMQDVLAALQYSHERGVVHRDVKPANVMLTSTGQAKLTDFGIARIESSSMTQAGTVLGTPAYMSPEQFMGQIVDTRTDIYSAGVLLYQLLTGERPFEGGMSAIMHKALNTDPPLPSLIAVTSPPSFDAVVRRAMAKRPDERFATAAAFAEALRHAASAPDTDATILYTSPAQSAGEAREGVPRKSRLPLIATALAVLIVLAAAAGWYLTHPPAQQAAQPQLDQLRHLVAEWINAHHCAMLDSSVRADGTVSLAGLAGETDAPILRQNLTTIAQGRAIDWHVTTIAPVFCPMLDALRPAENSGLTLTMADGARLHDGDLVRLKLTTPDYSGFLRVDYIVHDGSVQHLYPQIADAKASIAADPPRVFAAHDAIALGNPAWTIGEPYGTDMIIAVVSSDPLFTAPRPTNAETLDTYTRDLAAAIRAAKSHGAQVSATAITLETLPK